MAARSRRRWPWLLLAVLLVLLALAWWFPARWAWRLVQDDYPTVRVGAMSGSVWAGEAKGLVVNGQHLGRLDWTLSRMAVFGHLRGQVALSGAGVMIHGHIARADDDAIVASKLDFSVPMKRLKVLWPAGMRLEGTVAGHVDKLRLVDGWPTQLQARVTWRSAQVDDAEREVMLGDIQSRWQTQGGSVIRADLADEGTDGPLSLRGQFVATTLGWRLDVTMRPRGAHPALRRLLERFGQRQPDGSVRMQRHGGLAMAEIAP
ncbi:MAG TPA: type II secretion system protein N [Oleiagrimonas sp.]|nr:type II secretion system protein N [Oleiagrimonas sp.]